MLALVTEWARVPRATSVEVTVPETFDDFYRREFNQLRALALVVTGSSSVAEDLCQDALTEAHRNWDRISSYDKPGAWVRRVMLNKSTSRFRRLKSETRALGSLKRRRLESVGPSEPLDDIWDAVRRLPTRQSQAVALFYWDDLPVGQIASVLECSTETVKTHLKRGRATLSVELEHFAGLDLS